MVVVRIRQMVSFGSVSEQFTIGSCRDSRHWSMEVGGRLIQVVVKVGFTVQVRF